jgi:hypothetical protein
MPVFEVVELDQEPGVVRYERASRERRGDGDRDEPGDRSTGQARFPFRPPCDGQTDKDERQTNRARFCPECAPKRHPGGNEVRDRMLARERGIPERAGNENEKADPKIVRRVPTMRQNRRVKDEEGQRDHACPEAGATARPERERQPEDSR